jgi:hypothetical protein
MRPPVELIVMCLGDSGPDTWYTARRSKTQTKHNKMKSRRNIKRTTALKVIDAGMGLLVMGKPSLATAASKPELSFRNETFY